MSIWLVAECILDRQGSGGGGTRRLSCGGLFQLECRLL